MTKIVKDYDSGEPLTGEPSFTLAQASAEEQSGTGAVPACQAKDGVWEHVQPGDVQRMRDLGYEVRTVYVE